LNRLKVLVGIAISAGLLGYLVWSVDVRELAATLARTRWEWVVLASALGPLGVWARGRRWWYLFPPDSKPPALVPATMIGFMANNVLPLRAGEFVRVWGHPSEDPRGYDLGGGAFHYPRSIAVDSQGESETNYPRGRTNLKKRVEGIIT